MRRALHRLTRDPRHFQIAVLTSLLAWGTLGLDLEVRPLPAAAALAAAVLTQLAVSRILAAARFDPRSPLISGLSLCLLLRTPSPAVAAVAGAVAIGGKLLFRVRGKHLFNPANLGLVTAMLLTRRAWVSPGQWGSAAFFAFLVAGVGFIVVRRAERSDVTWAFLAAWCAVVFGRALWLGDPLAIPLHQLRSGALLVFAFFMISDPKTTPDSRAGRLVFAALVAVVAGVIQFGFYRFDALIWALALSAPGVPLLDRLLPGRRFAWPGAKAGSAAPAPGTSTTALPSVPALVQRSPS